VVHNILRHLEVEISEKEESNQVCTRPWFLPADDGFYGLSLSIVGFVVWIVSPLVPNIRTSTTAM
jgi:hypothetical protein